MVSSIDFSAAYDLDKYPIDDNAQRAKVINVRHAVGLSPEEVELVIDRYLSLIIRNTKKAKHHLSHKIVWGKSIY
jgi:hypothetical protein